jgi:hypothetical protein
MNLSTFPACSLHPRGCSHHRRRRDCRQATPRTRWDGPVQANPAKAPGHCSPHPRDGPTGSTPVNPQLRCSPRECGWSLPRRRRDPRRRLLPARAETGAGPAGQVSGWKATAATWSGSWGDGGRDVGPVVQHGAAGGLEGSRPSRCAPRVRRRRGAWVSLLPRFLAASRAWCSATRARSAPDSSGPSKVGCWMGVVVSVISACYRRPYVISELRAPLASCRARRTRLGP